MKTKSVTETCGPLGKDHSYLGHFKNEKVLTQGHNDGPRIRDDVMPDRRAFSAGGSIGSERVGRLGAPSVTDEGEPVGFDNTLKQFSPDTRIGSARGDEKALKSLGKAFEARKRYSGGSI